MLRSILLSAALTLVLSHVAHAQQNNILGIWYFDRFGGPHGEIDKSSGVVQANKQNAGTMFTFTKDNKLITSLPGGSINNNNTQHYQLLSDPKLILIGRDTMRIMLLTSQILELYPTSETRPALFLKRNKDGKTAMSAPDK